MEKRNETKEIKLTREMRTSSIRALEGEGNERKFEVSFSSEEVYQRWYDAGEVLDHSEGCCDLTRLNEIGIVLFNHKRDVILGKIKKAWIEGGRGKAIIEFDTDEDAEIIYQKVKSGTLKTTSVGYMTEAEEFVKAGGKSADGRFAGPVYIAKKWIPHEISIVSVPADPTVGVGRSLESRNEASVSLDLLEKQLQINRM